MRVFGTNTSAGIELAFWPFNLYRLFTHSFERGVLQTVKSFSYAW